MKSQPEFESMLRSLIGQIEAQSDRVVFSFPVNLDREGRILDGAVLFGEEKLYLADVSREQILFSYVISEVSDARFEAFAGGAVCEICYRGVWQELCRAFSSEKENLSQLVRILKEIADGVLTPKNAVFHYRTSECPKCRRPIRPGSACPSCSDRKSTLKKLYPIARPELGRILISMLLFFLTSFLNVVLPMIQGRFVDGYLVTSDPQGVLNAFSSVLLVVGSMALIRVLITVFTVLRNNLLSIVSNRTMVELRRRIYTHIQTLSVAGISRHTAGDLMNRVSEDTGIISNFITTHLPALLEQLLVIFSVTAMFFLYSWELALLILIPVPFVVMMFRFVWRRNHKLYHRQWMESSNANTVLHDIFQGVRVVKVFGTEKDAIAKFEKAIRTQRDIAYRNEIAWAKAVPYAEFLIQIGHFILLYVVGNRILGGQMTVGQLTMFSSFVSLIYTPLRSMASYPRTIQRAITAINKVFEVLDEEPDVADRKGAVASEIRGEIRLEGIWFGYNENENVLEDVSVTVAPGEMLGIVGRSGVGKSTLINLVMRLYDVNRGRILVDGVDVRDLTQQSLRSQIGVVLQESFLFSGTVYENLAYAKPDADFEEIIRAAKLANAHNFIMKLPDGYNTFVGERGYTLSGGERQRIAIARAILHDPKILILDEATSALDTETEKQIQDALKRLCENRTTIAIAHRLSTLRNATKILVLDKKTVAEVGSHEELVAKEDGIYHSLVLAQREMSSVKRKKQEAEKD
ncbi:MAG: ABC transporter ATP-binding protein [Clostridia bacterium]|nr:ABC transporter ATP-binding protein [Clostridia bacterium]